MTRRSSRGVTVVTLLLVVALAAGLYWLIVFGGAYWENQEVKGLLRQAANQAYREHDDAKLRKDLLRRFDEVFGHEVEEFGRKKMVLPFEFDPQADLVIERTKIPPLITIDLVYDRRIQLPIIGGERVLQFRPHAQQELSDVKW